MLTIQTRRISASNTKPARIVCETIGTDSATRRYFSASPGGFDRTAQDCAAEYLRRVRPDHAIVLGNESADGTGHYTAQRVEPPRSSDGPSGVGVESINLIDDSINWNVLRSKEQTESLTLTVFHGGKVQTAASVEIYVGRSSSATRVYAVARLWSPDGTAFGCGSGHADGSGYCKSSAAAELALLAAGLKLDRNIGGTGMGSVRAALIAYGHAAGWQMAGHSV